MSAGTELATARDLWYISSDRKRGVGKTTPSILKRGE